MHPVTLKHALLRREYLYAYKIYTLVMVSLLFLPNEATNTEGKIHVLYHLKLKLYGQMQAFF